jgi:hypothetical protein
MEAKHLNLIQYQRYLEYLQVSIRIRNVLRQHVEFCLSGRYRVSDEYFYSNDKIDTSGFYLLHSFYLVFPANLQADEGHPACMFSRSNES